MGATRNVIDVNHGNVFGRGFSSKYPGVSWDRTRRKWFTCIKINGKTQFLGRYKTELEGYEAYKNKLKDC